MPRYYIDTDDGAVNMRDDEGEQFSDVEAARRAVIATLPGLVDEIGPDGQNRMFVASLRDERGRTLYVAKLRFQAEWHAW